MNSSLNAIGGVSEAEDVAERILSLLESALR